MDIDVLVLQRIIPHYRVPIFEELSKEFSICVIHSAEHKSSSLKDEDSCSGFRNLKVWRWYPTSKDSIIFQNIYIPIFKFRPKIVISEFGIGNIGCWALPLLKRFFGFKLIYWTFGYHPFKEFNPEKSINDKMRTFLYNQSDAIIFYWQRGLEIVRPYVKDSKRLFVAPNTLVTNKLIKIRNRFENEGRLKIKSRLKINQSKVIIFVGRLIWDKQVDMLVKSFVDVKNKITDCALFIVGDGPLRKNLEVLCEQLSLKDVFFTGSILDDEAIGELLYISDVMVMPGRLGLSVIHSYCFDTPVISQNKDHAFHGEGVFYLKNGQTGFLVEDGNQNELTSRIMIVLEDDRLKVFFRKNIRTVLEKECGIEKFIEGFGNAINFVSDN